MAKAKAMSPIELVRQESLTSLVEREIERRILDGELKPGPVQGSVARYATTEPAAARSQPCGLRAAQCSRIRLRKCRARSLRASPKKRAGGACSTISPWSMKTTRSATRRAKPIS